MRYEKHVLAASFSLSFALFVSGADASASPPSEPPRPSPAVGPRAIQPVLFQSFAYVPNAPWDKRPPLPVWPKAVFWNGIVFGGISLLFVVGGLLGAASADRWTDTAVAVTVGGGIGLAVSGAAIGIGAYYWPKPPPPDYWDILREHRWAKPPTGLSYGISF